MIRYPLVVGIDSPGDHPGPYVYCIKASDRCAGNDVTFINGDDRSINEIIINSNNPSIEIEVEAEEDCCDKIADFDIAVSRNVDINGQTAECSAKLMVASMNPCHGMIATLVPLAASGNRQKFTANVSGGNMPFKYNWAVKGKSQIVDGQNKDCVTIDRKDGDDFEVCLEVMDANGCMIEVRNSIPPLSQMPPVLQDCVYKRLSCDQPVNVAHIYDVVAKGSDIDGFIDLNTIEIVSQPTQGDVVIDPITGLVTYTGDFSAVGVDTFDIRVRDNNGNYSNIAMIAIDHSCVNAEPVLADDVFTALCGETITFNPLDNDTNVNNTTLQILINGVIGNAVLLSNGMIQYTPTGSGNDIIRYIVSSPQGEQEVGNIFIAVAECCEDYTAGLEFTLDEQGQCPPCGDVTVSVRISKDDNGVQWQVLAASDDGPCQFTGMIGPDQLVGGNGADLGGFTANPGAIDIPFEINIAPKNGCTYDQIGAVLPLYFDPGQPDTPGLPPSLYENDFVLVSNQTNETDCEGRTVEICASATGSVNNAVTDEISYMSNGMPGVGNCVELPSSTLDVETISNLSGNSFILTWGNNGDGTCNIEIAINPQSSLSDMNDLIEKIRGCEVVRFGTTDLDQWPSAFLTGNITNLNSPGVSILKFTYTKPLGYTSDCPELASMVNRSSTQLSNQGSQSGSSLMATCFSKSENGQCVDFIRRITRAGCPDIVLRYRTCVNNGVLTTEVLEGSEGSGVVKDCDNYDVIITGSELQTLLIGGNNILDQGYSINDTLQIESFLNSYLSANGGGTAEVVSGADKLIVRFLCVGVTPTTISTDSNTGNFNAV